MKVSSQLYTSLMLSNGCLGPGTELTDFFPHVLLFYEFMVQEHIVIGVMFQG